MFSFVRRFFSTAGTVTPMVKELVESSIESNPVVVSHYSLP
jgi:hypothetical protein